MPRRRILILFMTFFVSNILGREIEKFILLVSCILSS